MINKAMCVMTSILVLSVNSLFAMEMDNELGQGISVSQPIPIPSPKSFSVSMPSPPEFIMEERRKRFMDVPLLSLIALNQEKKDEISPKTSPMMISPTTEPKRRVSKTLPYERSRKSSGFLKTSPKTITSAILKNTPPVLTDDLVSRSRSVSPEKGISSSNEELSSLSKEITSVNMEISSSPVERPVNSSQVVPSGWEVKKTSGGSRKFSFGGEDRGAAMDLLPEDHIEKVSAELKKEMLERKRDESPLRQRAESPTQPSEARRDGSITPQRERGAGK